MLLLTSVQYYVSSAQSLCSIELVVYSTTGCPQSKPDVQLLTTSYELHGLSLIISHLVSLSYLSLLRRWVTSYRMPSTGSMSSF
jgi:hypothetical protein